MTEDTAKRSLRESLSALVDNQVTELELHRILKESEGDSEIRSIWARYQLASAALKGEMAAGDYIDLSARIRMAIADESPLNAEVADLPNQAIAPRAWWKPLGRFAIAASVAGVVIIGAQQSMVLMSAGEGSVGEGGEIAADHTPAVALPPAARRVSLGDDVQARAAQNQAVMFIPATTATGESQVPDDVIQTRLNHLMLEHAEHAAQNSGRGMLPFARIPRMDEGEYSRMDQDTSGPR